MNPQMFSVLSEPNRFHIIELLRNKPHPVNEIVDQLHLNQPQVSKHLKVLADAGLVKATPIANQRVYELKPDRFKELDSWLEKYRSLWERRFDRLDKILKQELKKAKK